ncbi:MAG: LysR family transcriptional regulator [Rhizomicrobium sp.]
MNNLAGLDLNLLLTLDALLAERNVTRAAKRLHLSQPSVSVQLGKLRAFFDDPLLLPGRAACGPPRARRRFTSPCALR